jgi:hypothetical protein
MDLRQARSRGKGRSGSSSSQALQVQAPEQEDIEVQEAADDDTESDGPPPLVESSAEEAGDTEASSTSSSLPERFSYGVTKHRDIQATDLRVIDPMLDDGVWVIVDEGANSCVHGEQWRKNADAKYAKKGFKTHWSSKEAKNFKGIGSQKTSGKLIFPFGLLIKEANMTIPGLLDSNEVPNSAMPMLLSQNAQAHLGMAKDMRHGTIRLADYDLREIEVVRQKNTGLFMIRIDNLEMKRYLTGPQQMLKRKLLLDPSVCDKTMRQLALSSDSGEESSVCSVAESHRGCMVEGPQQEVIQDQDALAQEIYYQDPEPLHPIWPAMILSW